MRCACTHAACSSAALAACGPVYRCTTCMHAPILCADHIVSSHACNPFHIIEQWSNEEGCWVRMSLRSLKFAFMLGHQGARCPFAARAAPRTLTVVSEHGVFPFDFIFCHCEHKSRSDNLDALQLVRHGLWPGSWKQPRTVYTMAVMERFRSLAVLAHTNAYDYDKFLHSLFDDLVPEDAPVSMLMLCGVHALKSRRIAIANFFSRPANTTLFGSAWSMVPHRVTTCRHEVLQRYARAVLTLGLTWILSGRAVRRISSTQFRSVRATSLTS